MTIPRSPRRKITPVRITILIAVVIAVLIFERLALSGIARPDWVFDGAYADYYGTGELLDGTPYAYNATITVLAYNSSDAQVLNEQSLNIGGEYHSNNSTYWENYKAAPLVDPGASGGAAYTTNATVLYIDGKNVEATATYFRHTLTTDNGLSETDVITVFSSPSLGFPVGLRITYSDGTMSSYLMRTDIPGLLP